MARRGEYEIAAIELAGSKESAVFIHLLILEFFSFFISSFFLHSLYLKVTVSLVRRAVKSDAAAIRRLISPFSVGVFGNQNPARLM